jgi:hypothetical protein
MDEHWEWLGDVYARELTMAPSGYFKRQCFVSVECDEEPVKHVIDAIGDDRIVFSTDFPHGGLEVPPGGGVVPPVADLRVEQAQDPLGQLRRVLRTRYLIVESPEALDSPGGVRWRRTS